MFMLASYTSLSVSPFPLNPTQIGLTTKTTRAQVSDHVSPSSILTSSHFVSRPPYIFNKKTVWIFTLNPKDGSYVEEAAHIQPTVGLQANMLFGSDVAISKDGDVIAVSGINYNVNEGAMWVYRYNKNRLMWEEVRRRWVWAG